jgi:hypothetical protein
MVFDRMHDPTDADVGPDDGRVRMSFEEVLELL